jgi:hypothetical protein
MKWYCTEIILFVRRSWILPMDHVVSLILPCSVQSAVFGVVLTGAIKMRTKFWSGNLKGADYLGDIFVVGRTKLKLILKVGVRV